MQADGGGRPLEPTDFLFYGFGDRSAPLESWVRGLGIRSGEPRVRTVENGIYLPITTSVVDGRREQRGGIADADGSPIAADLRDRHGSVAPEPVRLVDEEAIYLGWLFGHYAHFLLESLARIWFLKEIDPSVRVVFHPATVRLAPGRPPTGVAWLWRLLEAFGVPLERILVLDEPTRLRRLIVPEPLYELSRWAHERAAEPYRAAAARIVGSDGVSSSTQPVYLSRRRLPSTQRQIVGEDELEETLRASGFLVVHPETMTFEEQVRLFNRHDDFVAAEGAAAYGVLFALGGPRLHLLTEALPFPDFLLVPAVAGTPASYVRCLEEGVREPPPGSGRLFPRLLEPETALTYLHERGFIATRPEAARTNSEAARRAHHDEAWLYARARQAMKAARRAALAGPQDGAFTEAEEREAVRLAATSWPLSCALARYDAARDGAQVDEMVSRFAALAATETDAYRLARYGAEVRRMAREITGSCRPETAARLAAVLADRFAA